MGKTIRNFGGGTTMRRELKHKKSKRHKTRKDFGMTSGVMNHEQSKNGRYAVKYVDYIKYGYPTEWRSRAVIKEKELKELSEQEILNKLI